VLCISKRKKNWLKNAATLAWTGKGSKSGDMGIVLSKGFGNPRDTQVRVWRVGVRVWNV